MYLENGPRGGDFAVWVGILDKKYGLGVVLWDFFGSHPSQPISPPTGEGQRIDWRIITDFVCVFVTVWAPIYIKIPLWN